jgi:thiol-disulfide isomerase/thioredoxin
MNKTKRKLIAVAVFAASLLGHLYTQAQAIAASSDRQSIQSKMQQRDTSFHGIAFEHNLTWQEILEKAKKEHKGVFVDCYASWCGPCKWMDQNVYSNDTVGEIVGQDYIAVRLQMDTTAHDEMEVQKGYSTAHMLAERYRIRAYPTFLFFASDGRMVHKAVGIYSLTNFIRLAIVAQNDSMQYYTLLAKYFRGEKKYSVMPYLASEAKELEEDSVANVIAYDYISGYLKNIDDSLLWTETNTTFINTFREVLHYHDAIVQRYLNHKQNIDSLEAHKAYAANLVNYFVDHEDIKPIVDKAIKDSIEPNWHKMIIAIRDKYGNGYSHNIVKARVRYYKSLGRWRNYTKYLVQQINETNIRSWPPGLGASMMLNNDAMEVFEYSTNKKELEEALLWIDLAMSMLSMADATELDTKAGLLYKLGRRKEGVMLEEQSLKLAPENSDIKEDYLKMKNGLPTW